MAKQTIYRTGHSLGITIPFRLVNQLGLEAGQFVAVRSEPDTNRMVVEFIGANQLPLSKSLPEDDANKPKL